MPPTPFQNLQFPISDVNGTEPAESIGTLLWARLVVTARVRANSSAENMPRFDR